MSADGLAPLPEMPPPRVARRQEQRHTDHPVHHPPTVILTAATVWGGRVWLRNSETLVFAVADANRPEARFAARLASVLSEQFLAAAAQDRALRRHRQGAHGIRSQDANIAVLRTDAQGPAARPCTCDP